MSFFADVLFAAVFFAVVVFAAFSVVEVLAGSAFAAFCWVSVLIVSVFAEDVLTVPAFFASDVAFFVAMIFPPQSSKAICFSCELL